MATLATRRRREVAGRLSGSYRAVVAVGTARADCNINVELGWCPGRVALVASRAVSRCRNMVHPLTGGFRAIVAVRTRGSTGKRAVVGLGAGPDRG